MAMDQQQKEDEATNDDVTAVTSDADETKNLAEPMAARRADALGQIARTYMNNNQSSGSSADRYQVIVHTTVKESSEQKAEPDVTAVTPHIEEGPGLCEECTGTTSSTGRRVARQALVT